MTILTGVFCVSKSVMADGGAPLSKEQIDAANEELLSIATENELLGLIYLQEEYDVMSEPDGGDVVATLATGYSVRIWEAAYDEGGNVWLYVSFFIDDNMYAGYVYRGNIATSDELFLAWEEKHGFYDAPSMWRLFAFTRQEYSSDVAMFPASYRDSLQILKETHPNWTFVVQRTGLNWSTVIDNEAVGDRSLVSAGSEAWMKGELYGQSWHYATRAAVEYYADPRNYLTEERIFAFEQLTYNPSYHTEESVQKLLAGTFMSGPLKNPSAYDDASMTYAKAFTKAGQESGISPFHLASRVRQEQGQGSSPLISGSYAGYQGYYNYFNVGASGNSNEAVIVNGLNYAKDKNWNSVYASIKGGADTISKGYILSGQDTIYLEKFDVDDSAKGLYWHQYMQNLAAPMNESKIQRNGYANAGALDNTFVFKIPIYENMPNESDPYPLPVTEISVKIPEGYTDNTLWIDGIAYTGQRDVLGNLKVDTGKNTAKSVVMYKYDEAGKPVGMSVWTLHYNGYNYLVTERPGLKDLLSYNGFSIRFTEPSGIRMKTGIAVATRNKLVTTGIEGYKLKSYGSLLMTEANRANNPMVLGGDRVKNAVSYDGAGTDKVYETVDGRYRYTVVLTGLPVEQYKTELAFRGYIVLTDGTNDITLYGPVQTRSIYGLAQSILGTGAYAEGTQAFDSLNRIIGEADGTYVPNEPETDENEKQTEDGGEETENGGEGTENGGEGTNDNNGGTGNEGCENGNEEGEEGNEQ